MAMVVIFLFRPGLGDLVEAFQGEIGHILQHCHQATFQRGPKGLLFGILIGTVGQRGLMQDAQGVQAGGKLIGLHGAAVIAHQGSGQSPFLQA